MRWRGVPKRCQSPSPKPRGDGGPGQSAVPWAVSVPALPRAAASKPCRSASHPGVTTQSIGLAPIPFLPAMCWGQELTSRYKTGRVPASTCLATSVGIAQEYCTPGSIVLLASPHTCPHTCPHAGSLHFCSPYHPFSSTSVGAALLPTRASIPGGAEGEAAAAPLGRRLPVRSHYSPQDAGTRWPSPALAAGQVLRATGIPCPLLCPSAGCDASEHSSGAGGK